MVARSFPYSEGGISTNSCDFDTFGVPLVGVSLLTSFLSIFGVAVFFGFAFEYLTGVSGTMATLAASLRAGVVFGTPWKVHG